MTSLVSSDGVRVEFSKSGRSDGRVAILLHGLGGTRSVWQLAGPALAPRFCVLAPDHRGHGSSGGDETTDYSIERLAKDVWDLADSQGAREVTILGHGMGAQVAMVAALSDPRRVEALVCVGASVSPLDSSSGWIRTRGLAAKAARESGIDAAWEVYLEGGIFGLNPEDVPEEIVDGWRRDFVSTRAAAFSGLAEELATHADLSERLSTLRVPTLVVCGTDDQPYSHRADELAAAIPSAELAWVAGGGHTPQLAESDTFNQFVVEFLRRAMPVRS